MKNIVFLITLYSCMALPLSARTFRAAESPAAAGGMLEIMGMYGPYPLSREGSGTSWQPDSSPLEGYHVSEASSTLMLHGFLYGINDHQGSPRGGEKNVISNMMGIALQQSLKSATLGIRTMFSLDPISGADGHPLLLQTGETYNGRPLIDRQHPHEFFTELSASLSVPYSGKRSVFLYAGLPGEPALGPPVYLQRFSGMNNPSAPISHHWLDSTHMTFGVVTLGYVADRVKVEGSAFRGREPDENHWNIETPKLDSYSMRLSWNLARNWSAQASYGFLNSPEALTPDVDIGRYTASVIYNKAYRDGNDQITVAWGTNDKRPGPWLNAYLLESAFAFIRAHVIFFRVEQVDKDELFPPGDPNYGRVFTVNKGNLGYLYNFPAWGHVQFALGASGSVSITSNDLLPYYGSEPFSYMLFARLRLVEMGV